MGHASIQLTVKLYGHLQPGANTHWMNFLPGATAPVATATAAPALGSNPAPGCTQGRIEQKAA